LRAHGGKRAQDDQVECALEQLNLISIFAWHPSDLPPFRIAQAVLECQVEIIFLRLSAISLVLPAQAYPDFLVGAASDDRVCALRKVSHRRSTVSASS
jgi:hypothetical protein